MICNNINVNEDGILTFAGYNTVELAKKYGTPLYLMDENKIREKCRIYVNAMNKYFDGKGKAFYASKAASFMRMYSIMKEENMGVDVVSTGEMYTAIKAGYPIENACFHSNNKTDADIEFAIKNKIGCFVADSVTELEVINEIAGNMGVKQNVMLRLTPGIDTHTYEAVNTGKVDSKFGIAIETNQAYDALEEALKLTNLNVEGFHCHIGSQVFDSDTFIRGAEIMLDFIATVKEKYGFITNKLDLGGGYGVKYVEGDGEIDIDANIKQVAEFVKSYCKTKNIEVPFIMMEPGRSIVADAGMTLYTVGTIKEITGYKNYVSIDGGMTDNPRFALYGSNYTVILANRVNEDCNFDCSVVGRCCESGDIIQENVLMPKPKRGDIVAVCTTGAYNYSMASNYNRIPRPPVVMLNSNQDYVAVKRETLDDIISNDC